MAKTHTPLTRGPSAGKAPKKAKDAAPEQREVKEYKLLVSQHIGPDHTEEPVISEDPKTHVKTYRWPSRLYRPGETVPSETDLVARFGAEKFQYVGDPHPDTVYFGTGSDQPGDPTPMNLAKSATVAPHGQVGTGYPEAISGATGSVKQGPAGPATLEALHERQEELAASEAEKREVAEKEAAEAKEADTKEPDAPHTAHRHGRGRGR